MTKNEAYKKYDDEVEKHEANCTCQDYFNAGWDACEEVWLTENPNKDLMIAELEEKNKELKNESYEDAYVSAYKRATEYMKIVAMFSTVLAIDEPSDNKIKKINEIMNNFRKNLGNSLD